MTALKPEAGSDVERMVRRLAEEAKTASATLALASTQAKNAALTAAAEAIRRRTAALLAANRRDLEAADTRGLSGALRDRLALDEKRVEAIARGLEEVAAQPDPIGTVLARWTRPNGLDISRVRVPLGVIGVIFESRPNVTADAGGLCLKSGNAAILRGGSESFHSSRAIHEALLQGLRAAGLPEAAIQLVPTTDRAAVSALLKLDGLIDVIVPRGGRSLIERVVAESRIPVLKHLDGICHTYVDGAADLKMARRIVLNAKMRRTGICGATETLLVDRKAAATHLPSILSDLINAGCEIRGDAETRSFHPDVKTASPQDWDTEHLDAILSVRVVDGIEEAIGHISRHGSGHTEAIVTEDAAAAERFLAAVDAGIVMVNASTQFADGGEFGMGAEIGISTGKLHARGPVGAEQLTSIKYVVRGTGQVRP
ncbi:MAG TPA: glutamate-5-semialdehyde dehydrogenase [Alphaproteobacteria bacterium]|nr:glutamate-5-semialdehyde dehydrogenase [Alphaproteobacteria bacterium]